MSCCKFSEFWLQFYFTLFWDYLALKKQASKIQNKISINFTRFLSYIKIFEVIPIKHKEAKNKQKNIRNISLVIHLKPCSVSYAMFPNTWLPYSNFHLKSYPIIINNRPLHAFAIQNEQSSYASIHASDILRYGLSAAVGSLISS